MTNKLLLPDGYSLVDANFITASEIMDLRSSVNWDSRTESEWDACLRQSLHVSGIRDAKNLLVAAGFLAGNLRHAILCDLTVHSHHQRMGLARIILFDRLKRADELKIPFLYTSLSSDNHLRKQYFELGFKQTGGELFWQREF